MSEANVDHPITENQPTVKSADASVVVGFGGIMVDVFSELREACKEYAPMYSLMEASSILREEYEEFWELCRQRQASRDSLREELLQVAAVALRAIHDLDLAKCVPGDKRPLYVDIARYRSPLYKTVKLEELNAKS